MTWRGAVKRGGRRSESAIAAAVLVLLLLLLVVGAPRVHAIVHPVALFYDHLGAKAELDHTAELHCLALNIYHEARGENDAGRLAVASVTMNRVRSRRFPDSVCKVVWQRGQFSWTKDGRPDRPYERKAWSKALTTATLVYEYGQSSSVGPATFYHAKHVNPFWARDMEPVAKVGRHLFY